MTLEEVLSVMEKAEAAGKTTVRLHTGDPCIYGAIREQMDVLDEKGIAYDYCPGVSAFCGAARSSAASDVYKRQEELRFRQRKAFSPLLPIRQLWLFFSVQECWKN